jgi:dihydroorotase
VGQVADIAAFTIESGVFAFKDAWHNKNLATKKLECVLTIREGQEVFNRDGRGYPEWTAAGKYEVIQ